MMEARNYWSRKPAAHVVRADPERAPEQGQVLPGIKTIAQTEIGAAEQQAPRLISCPRPRPTSAFNQRRPSSSGASARTGSASAGQHAASMPPCRPARPASASPSVRDTRRSSDLILIAEQAAQTTHGLASWRRTRSGANSSIVAQLRDLFPAWEDEAISDVVDSVGGSLESAISTLLAWTEETNCVTSAPNASGQGQPSTSVQCARPKLEPVSPWHGERSKVRNGNAVHKAFMAYDTNGDGTISQAELTAVIKAMNPDVATNDLRLVFQAVDKNGDGNINLEEFISWVWEDGCISSIDATPAALPREGYDRIISKRLSRRCSSNCLAGVLKAKTIWKQLWLAKRVVAQNHAGSGTAVSLTDIGLNMGHEKQQTGIFRRGSFIQREMELEAELKTLAREDRILAGKELLRQRCKFLGMQSMSMKDDGNCQFRAISQELYGTQEHHVTVRVNIVNYMRCHSGQFSSFFEEGEWQEYLRTMETPKTWGDEITLRVAAEVFKIRIHVLSSTDTNWYLVYEPIGSVMQGGREVFLTYVAPIHYNTLAPLR